MRSIFIAAIAILLVISCATLRGNPDLLTFLVDGRTTRTEVLTTLGQPSGRFENDRILTYRIGVESKNNGYYIVEREVASNAKWPTWLQAKYSLVLEFDVNGVLRKHPLVKVNK